MSVVVINGLKMIDVGHDDGEMLPLAQGTRHFAFQMLENRGAVPYSGQAIVRGLQFEAFHRSEQLSLQVENAFAREESCMEFVGIDRLEEKLIGAGRKPFEKFRTLISARHQNEIRIGAIRLAPDRSTNIDTGNTWHNPIEHGEMW